MAAALSFFLLGVAPMPLTAAPHTPTREDITAGCLAIRAEWSAEEHERRLMAAVNSQVKLLAGILCPMAIDAGYVSSVSTVDTEVETMDADSIFCTPAA